MSEEKTKKRSNMVTLEGICPLEEEGLRHQEAAVVESFFCNVPIGHTRQVICFDFSTREIYLRKATRNRYGVRFTDGGREEEHKSYYIVAFCA